MTTSSDAGRSPWSVLLQWIPVWLYLGSTGAVLALFAFFARLPAPIHLNDTHPLLELACGSAGRPPLQALVLFAAQARWLSFALLLTTTAAIALVTAVVTLVASARGAPEGSRQPWVVLTLIAVAVAAIHIWRLNWGDQAGTGFLTSLLGTIAPAENCRDIRSMVWPMRTIGEGCALIVAAAMAATALPTSDPSAVARCIKRLQLLLYCASLLFVTGILMSESNFTWVTSQWAWLARDEHVSKAIGDVIRAGTLQSGVGYSSLLVVFFLPARSYLAWQARRVAPEAQPQDRAQEQKALVDAGLVGSWREDVKQILALLAPVLSAPLFDAWLK